MVNNRLAVTLGALPLAAPLLTASGTSGSGGELGNLRKSEDIARCLGAFVTKGVTLNARAGNPGYRVVETRTGVLNSIGLQNNGAAAFVEKALPLLVEYGAPILVNISAGSVEEFGILADYLATHDVNGIIAGFEINVSCPNICEGGMAFGTNPKLVERIAKTVKRYARPGMTILTKLSPNVTDITLPARAAIAGGTDGLSMINTLRGMAIDVHTGKPFLGNVYGGLSGPAIKPVGVYMVYECFKKIPECRDRRIPIVGIGGVSNWQDALEYIMAGATAVGVGTAWFVNINVFQEIHAGLLKYAEAQGTTIQAVIGRSHELANAAGGQVASGASGGMCAVAGGKRKRRLKDKG